MLSHDTDLCVCLLQREEDGDLFTAIWASDIIMIGPFKLLLTSINVVAKIIFATKLKIMM